VVLGRLLAYCVHPVAAWRRLSAADRTLLVVTYFGAGYLLTLLALVTI
jgi:hypothetical protein